MRHPSLLNPFSLGLLPGEVHIWHGHVGTRNDESTIKSYANLLSPEEALYAGRCSPARQLEYIVTRGALRLLLSRYFPESSPKDWKFISNQYGKPELAGTLPIKDFRFNVSHSTGLITLAFGSCLALGVDVERIAKKGGDFAAIARDHFSSEEFCELETHAGPSYMQRFFEYWTLKEAFIKAVGMGLSLPLDQFTVRLHNANPLQIQLSISDDIKWIGENWRLSLHIPKPGYQVALAMQSSTPMDVIEKGIFELPSGWFKNAA